MAAFFAVVSLVEDFDISGGDNSITNCNTRSIKLLVVMRQLDLVVVIEGDDMVLLGLGPLLDGGVCCLLVLVNRELSLYFRVNFAIIYFRTQYYSNNGLL